MKLLLLIIYLLPIILMAGVCIRVIKSEKYAVKYEMETTREIFIVMGISVIPLFNWFIVYGFLSTFGPKMRWKKLH